MRELLILVVHLLVTVAKLLRLGGVRAVAAESLLLKHQLLISNRSKQRAPNLTTLDRFVLGLTTLFVSPRRDSETWRAHQARILQSASRSEILRALVIEALTGYETAKARAGVTLSAKIFVRRNPEVSEEWIKV